MLTKYQINESSESQLDENNSLKKILTAVGYQKRVIDFGCSTGYLAKMLVERGCQVTGVEVNAEAAQVAENYCERVIIGNVEDLNIAEVFPEEQFDVAIFGDVLEHLKDPKTFLEITRSLLTPTGYVVASIPNIAHGAVRLALLQGHFNYTSLGILDETHLRFFTRTTMEQLFLDAGYEIDSIDCTDLPFLTPSPLLPEFDRGRVDQTVLTALEKAADVNVFQFIITAFPVSTQNRELRLQKQLAEKKQELDSVKQELAAIKSSKFWKLREIWFNFKQKVF
ncbi:MAG: methyltransferase domain-containing protein [Kamptonema sp. SIO4C4]|nr:methyltransferase domain-containing protein [Kamptonema sp. SIO4C4]